MCAIIRYINQTLTMSADGIRANLKGRPMQWPHLISKLNKKLYVMSINLSRVI